MAKKKELTEEERGNLEAELRALHSSLSAASSGVGDWKVIKCYEATLKGTSAPYNVEELLAERQQIRDRINEIEALLS